MKSRSRGLGVCCEVITTSVRTYCKKLTGYTFRATTFNMSPLILFLRTRVSTVRKRNVPIVYISFYVFPLIKIYMSN